MDIFGKNITGKDIAKLAGVAGFALNVGCGAASQQPVDNLSDSFNRQIVNTFRARGLPTNPEAYIQPDCQYTGTSVDVKRFEEGRKKNREGSITIQQLCPTQNNSTFMTNFVTEDPRLYMLDNGKVVIDTSSQRGPFKGETVSYNFGDHSPRKLSASPVLPFSNTMNDPTYTDQTSEVAELKKYDKCDSFLESTELNFDPQGNVWLVDVHKTRIQCGEFTPPVDVFFRCEDPVIGITREGLPIVVNCGSKPHFEVTPSDKKQGKID